MTTLEIRIPGPKSAAVVAEFLPKIIEANNEDNDAFEAKADARWAAERAGVGTGNIGQPQPSSDSPATGTLGLVTVTSAEPPKRRAGRVYGKASAGKTRRSGEELMEDKELDELALALGKSADDLMSASVAELLLAWRKESNEAPQRNITATPEDRKDPANPEPAEEEAEEALTGEIVDDANVAPPPATLDDVKAAMNKYLTKFGPGAFTPENRKAMLQGYEGLSKLPTDDPGLYGKIVVGIEDMIRNG